MRATTVVAMTLAMALATACGKVAGEHAPPETVDAAPDAPAAPGVERCTSSTVKGASSVDEDADGKIDEGCEWHFGTPQWLPPVVPAVPLESDKRYGFIDPSWVSPDGLRLYVVYGDGTSNRVLVLHRTERGGPFRAARNPPSGDDLLTGVDLASHSIVGITLSQDEKEAIFSSRPVGKPADPVAMFRMTRDAADGSFKRAEALPALSTVTDVERPSLSSDGRELFYAAHRKLRRAVRSSPADAFGAPEDLSGITEGDANAPFLARDGQTLFYYVSPAGKPFRIVRAQRVEAGGKRFGEPVDLAELDTSGQLNSAHPVLSESTHELIFASGRAWGVNGAVSLWRAQLCRDAVCANPLVPCDGVRSPDGLHCYTKLDTLVTRKAAETACQNAGGHLASVHSRDEQDLIWALAANQSRWVGGYDDERNGVHECNSADRAGEQDFPCAWGWENGEAWTYAFWRRDATILEPEDGGAAGQDCVVMWQLYDGKWADISCDDSMKLGAVCETSLFPTW